MVTVQPTHLTPSERLCHGTKASLWHLHGNHQILIRTKAERADKNTFACPMSSTFIRHTSLSSKLWAILLSQHLPRPDYHIIHFLEFGRCSLNTLLWIHQCLKLASSAQKFWLTLSEHCQGKFSFIQISRDFMKHKGLRHQIPSQV